MNTLLDGHRITPVTEADVYGKQPKPGDAGVPGLAPGQEVRGKSFIVPFGQDFPRELVELLSTPDKYRARPPIVETDMNRDRHIITVWYVQGGLLNEVRPPAKKENEKKEKKEKFDDAPDLISESAKLDAIESSDFDDVTPPPEPNAEGAAPAETAPPAAPVEEPAPPPAEDPVDGHDADLDAEIRERGSADSEGAAGAGTGPHRPPWAE